jgi:hypothetical protein
MLLTANEFQQPDYFWPQPLQWIRAITAFLKSPRLSDLSDIQGFAGGDNPRPCLLG